MGESLKLTAYLGERDRCGGEFAGDALISLFARSGVAISAQFRGLAGFGRRHAIRSAQLLTLSEDLPIVVVAVDRRELVEGLVGDTAALLGDGGLLTLERARLIAAGGGPPAATIDGDVKLTIYLGRHRRAAGRPGHETVVAALHECGVAGATALLGVDGAFATARRRARFLGRNPDVPVMVVSVGDRSSITRAIGRIRNLLPDPPMTLERVRVCKRDGRALGPLPGHPGSDRSGLAVWQKLMIYSSEQSTVAGEPLYRALLRALRARDAAGATALRGFWGYHGGHDPHGDRLLAVRRRVPVVTILVDTPERIARLYPAIDALTAATGLITSEFVPALRAAAPANVHGGLRLAERPSLRS